MRTITGVCKPSTNVPFNEGDDVIRRIGRKHGLDGKSESEKIRIDIIQNVAYNSHVEFARVCYGQDFVSLKQINVMLRAIYYCY